MRMIRQGKRSINVTSPFCENLSLWSFFFFFLFLLFVLVLYPACRISQKISLALHTIFYIIIYNYDHSFIFRDNSRCP